MATKRTHMEAFGDLTTMKCSPNAKIRGVLSGISPDMKKTGRCSYWDGELSDEKSSVRVYGFDNTVRKNLFKHQENRTTIQLTKCAIKTARNSDELEVFAGSSVMISESDNEMDPKLIKAQKLF